jgi:hypothetical protein
MRLAEVELGKTAFSPLEKTINGALEIMKLSAKASNNRNFNCLQVILFCPIINCLKTTM